MTTKITINLNAHKCYLVMDGNYISWIRTNWDNEEVAITMRVNDYGDDYWGFYLKGKEYQVKFMEDGREYILSTYAPEFN